MALMIATASFSQPAPTPPSLTLSKTLFTNADTGYAVTAPIFVPCDVITIQGSIAKASGTLGGIALVQGSLTGGTYDYQTLSTDTFKLTGVNYATHAWTFDKRKYFYYRIMYLPTGTETSAPSGVYLTTGLPKN